MQSSRSTTTGLPEPAEQVIHLIIENYRGAPGLSWIHGQGSVFSRFTDDSDLDFIIGWDAELPDHPTLPADLHSRMTPAGAVVLEQANANGYDLDVMHLPRSRFEDWLRLLDSSTRRPGSSPRCKINSATPCRPPSPSSKAARAAAITGFITASPSSC